jgi:cardiolipin synthase
LFSEIIRLIVSAAFVLNIIFGVIVVFYERRNPAVTWAWLVVITLVPYVGFIIYLLIGLDSRKYGVFIDKAKRDEEIYQEFIALDGNKVLREQAEIIHQKNILRVKGSEHLNDMIYLNFFSGNGAFTNNNHLSLYFDGNGKFDAMLKDIKQARHFIHLQYYIIRNDETGRRLVDALAAKAAEGVEVRLLIDGMGCILTPRVFFKALLTAGGRLAEFMPPHFIRVNFRNHRKICVIDGSIGYIGGLNIGDEYLGRTKRFGFWRDTHVRIMGDAVNHLELRFLMDWNFCSKNQIALNDKYLRQGVSLGRGIGIQIVSSGPDTLQHNILYAYVKMINEADKSIYIQSPYFVPDDSVFEALRIAALSGIDVRIIIPASPDHPFVYWASLSYLGELLEVGVRCYLYRKGFVHSKLLMIDSLVCSVGTANMDVRSFKLNFECNAFIYDQKITKDLEAQYLRDIDDCVPLTQADYQSRGHWTKIRESVSRLLSPLL